MHAIFSNLDFSRGRSAFARRACGFTYLWVLFAVALLGVGLALMGEVWHTTLKREKERELLFIGDEFRRAVTRYFDATPTQPKQYPKKLEDLLEDKRFPDTRRYLRRIYNDPLTGMSDWGLVNAPDGGILGVYSKAPGKPLKKAEFAEAYADFSTAMTYADWKFTHVSGQGKKIRRPPAGDTAPVPTATDGGELAGEPPLTGPGAVPTAGEEPPPADLPVRRRDCQPQRKRDAGVCTYVMRIYGAGPGLECEASADQRLQMCEADVRGALPPLVVPRKDD